MTLPSPPPKRRFHMPPPSPRRADPRNRVRRIVSEHEERERPFDPEQAPTWRGSASDLVANPVRAGFRGPVELWGWDTVDKNWKSCGRQANVASAERAMKEYIEGGWSSDTIFRLEPIGTDPNAPSMTPELRLNPSGFKQDLRQLVHRYYPKLKAEDYSVDRGEMITYSEEELAAEIERAFEEQDTDDAMSRANELLEGHGVEALGPVDMHEGPPYTYINFGDTYDPTIMWSRDGNKVFVAMGGWGDVWSEEGEPNAQEEAWESHIRDEFATQVKNQLEVEADNAEGKEAEAWTFAFERFESLTSEEERKLFDRAMEQAQRAATSKYPEWIQESDGYAISYFDAIVDEAVELIREGALGSYEPNARDGQRWTIVHQPPGGPVEYGEGDVFDDREEAESTLRDLREQSADPNDQFYGYKWDVVEYKPNARRRTTYRLRGTADDHRDRQMLLGRSHRTVSSDHRTEVEALDAAERFMKDVSPQGRAAKVWVEESQPSGDFRVVAKWTGQYGAAGGLIWKPS